MFYLKYKGKKLEINGENVYTICSQCGKEHAVDLQQILEGGDADLYSTSVYCVMCSKARATNCSSKLTPTPLPKKLER